MTDISKHPLIGKWRITEMELWDADFIDLMEPGYFWLIQTVVAISSSVPSRADWTATTAQPHPLHLGRTRRDG
ncbi:MAG TPA: hypothetical protein VE690_09415 [Rhodopila sp.]|nr:hypothetical protein [Rhodopila sp.]